MTGYIQQTEDTLVFIEESLLHMARDLYLITHKGKEIAGHIKLVAGQAALMQKIIGGLRFTLSLRRDPKGPWHREGTKVLSDKADKLADEAVKIRTAAIAAETAGTIPPPSIRKALKNGSAAVRAG